MASAPSAPVPIPRAIRHGGRLRDAQDAYPNDDAVAGEPSLDDEAPEWDAQEQRQAVPQDDDYR